VDKRITRPYSFQKNEPKPHKFGKPQRFFTKKVIWSIFVYPRNSLYFVPDCLARA